MTYYRTTVLKVGPEAAEMAAAGVLILFAEPVPPALEELSIIHQPTQTLQGHAISVGDTVTIGAQDVRITAVGEIAANNLEELGHVVLYVNQPNQNLLPGAVHATGEMTTPQPDDVIEFRSSSS
jgi:PTS system glucitol/sorbitol-specific IIA component